MEPINDRECLRQYAQTGSDEAFAALVSRHLNLVYSAALRRTGDSAAAGEITQTVFVLFAQKAPRLPAGVVVAGWLYETTRLCAANFARSEFRRRRREHEAFMETKSDESSDEVWSRLSPVLEEAMGRLRQRDRDALLLRYFEGRSFAEVAAQMGASENAAKKFVARGVEKLRAALARRGVTSTTQLLSSVLAQRAVESGPASLLVRCSATSLKAHALTGSAAALVRQTAHTLLMAKLKFAGASLAGLLLAGAAGFALSQAFFQKPTAQEIARQSLAAYAALTSYAETETVISEVDGEKATNEVSLRLQRPAFYAIDSGNVRLWSDGTGNFRTRDRAGGTATEKLASRSEAFGAIGQISSPTAAVIPDLFFAPDAGQFLQLPAAGKDNPRRERDQRIDGSDCFVISTHSILWSDNSGHSGTTTNRLWIDKKSGLVRRSEQTWDKPTLPTVAAPRRINSIQTHEHILVNPPFTAADFAK